ncbi:hypothetical protein KA005_33090, partial [bacterium]|nr:hypothetical protein [bacterium]
VKHKGKGWHRRILIMLSTDLTSPNRLRERPTCQFTRPPGSAAFAFCGCQDNVLLRRPIHPVAGDFFVGL